MAFNNSIEHAKIYSQTLDEVAMQEATTSWMDNNAGQVIYNGGDEIKIPEMAFDGLADYDRNKGYADGNINFKYQTHKIKYDRGRRFLLDEMSVDETNFTATAPYALSEYTRTHIVPEVDAIRIAGLASAAKLEQEVGEEKLASFKDAVVQIRDAGYSGQLIAHVSYSFLNELEKELAGQLRSETFSINGVDTQLPSVDGVALIPTTSDKMNSEVTVTDGGWEPSGDKLDFVIAPLNGVIGVMKHNVKRIFSPDDNQFADGWVIPFRVYHDIIVPDNKAKLVCVGKTLAGE